eukprot:5268025-Pyramimonas_sp.AAC.1
MVRAAGRYATGRRRRDGRGGSGGPIRAGGPLVERRGRRAFQVDEGEVGRRRRGRAGGHQASA